jgi:hypothetical protein
MMDEKRLAQVAVQDTWHGQSHSWTLGDFTEEEACEVLRLARLGLWAEKHGIAQLKRIDFNGGHYLRFEPSGAGAGAGAVAALKDTLQWVREALAALPANDKPCTCTDDSQEPCASDRCRRYAIAALPKEKL